MNRSMGAEIRELRAMKTSELIARYEELWGKPPRCRHRAHLWRRCAWKLQERRFGGLSRRARDRLEDLIAEIDLPLDDGDRTVTGRVTGRRQSGELAVGTVLITTRSYKGEEVRVEVRDDGFEWDGEVFGSLSAVARAVTGSRWNGRLFFGLTERRPRS